jgi:hypothetical protein
VSKEGWSISSKAPSSSVESSENGHERSRRGVTGTRIGMVGAVLVCEDRYLQDFARERQSGLIFVVEE